MNQASEDEGYSSFEDYDDGGEEGGKENQLAPSTDEGSMEEGFMTKDEESHTRPPTIPEEEGPAPRAAAPAAGGAAAGAAAAAGGEEEGGGGDQEAAAALGRALAALRGAACRYNRDRDGVVMKSFEGSAFTVEEFRVMLGRAFHLKLSALEARCLARHLDRDGDAGVDGAEFLKEFFRLGFEERSRQQRARREKDWAARQKERAAQREKAAAALAAAERVATGPFAPADQQAALMKMTEAAVKYDRQAGLGLEGFQGSSMDAFVFKDQLRRVFRLKLSTAELSALIAYFDKDGDGTVDCAEFMIKFFQKGFEERTKRQKQIERRNKRAEQKALEERRRKEEEGMERAEAQVDHAFAARHEAAALGRLRAAAAEYDRHTGMSLKGFDGPDMTPAVFKEQLWRAFRVHLSPKELGAAMAHFDRDGSGTVECAEFLKAFFSLGAEERARRRRARRESQKRKEDEQRRQQEAKAKVAEERALGKVDWDFTEEDATSALALMREAAYKFVGSRHTPDANPLAAFQGTDMTPTVLGQQLRRALGVQATPRQLAALVRHFDKDGDGTVACAEFLIQFFRAGFEEHRKDTERHRAEEFRKAQADKAARKKKEAALEEKRQARYDPNWGEDDRGSALAKLTAVAAEYDPQSASAVGLEGFEGAGMTPFVFRDQLKRVFRIRLTPKELGALVAAFDKDGDGAIDCAEFLMRFHQLGFDERSRRRRDLRRRELRAAARAAAEERRKQAEALAKAQANVAPFEERHVDEVLQMVATAAAKYDQRTAGAAGLRAFEGAAMTPTELREQLRLAFGLRLTPAQLASWP